MESFKLTLTQQQIGRMLTILSKQPYDQVADIMQAANFQVASQMQEHRGAQQGTQAPQVNGIEDVH